MTTSRLIRLALRLALALVLASTSLAGALFTAPSAAHAQSADAGLTIFWNMQFDADVDAGERTDFDNELKRVLNRAQQRHFVTRTALLNHLASQPLQIPPCFEGATPCTSAPEQLAQALALNGVVSGRLSHAGDGEYALQLDYYREFGGGSKSVRKTGRIGDIVGQAVAELFTLEARLAIDSAPSGAMLYVNGKRIGTTPVDLPIGEGLHGVRIELEGYEEFRQDVAVTPGEQLELQFDLVPKLTQITVMTRAADAQVYVDGTFLGMAGNPIDVAPGAHLLELQAPGYRPIDIEVDIAAAQRRTVWLAMLGEVEDPWARRERAITRYPLYTEAGYDLMIQSGTFAGASGELAGGDVSIVGFDGQPDTTLVFHAANLSAGWTHDNFGLSIIGLTIGAAGLDETVSVQGDTGLSRFDNVLVDSVLHVGVYPLQPTARVIWGPFALDARTGIGLAYDQFSLDANGESFNLSDVNGFWNLAAGGRWYWAEEWYAGLGYQIEIDWTDTRDPRHGVLARIGYALPLLVDDGGAGQEVVPISIDDDVELDEPAGEPAELPDSLPPLRDEEGEPTP